MIKSLRVNHINFSGIKYIFSDMYINKMDFQDKMAYPQKIKIKTEKGHEKIPVLKNIKNGNLK